MVIVDTVTSIVGTIAIFLTLGHAAYVAGPDYSIDDLFNSGKLTRFQEGRWSWTFKLAQKRS